MTTQTIDLPARFAKYFFENDTRELSAADIEDVKILDRLGHFEGVLREKYIGRYDKKECEMQTYIYSYNT